MARLTLLCVMAMSVVGHVSPIDPGEQAQVSTALDSTQFVLGTISDGFKNEADDIKALWKQGGKTSTELLKKQTKLMKIASHVGKLLKMVQAASVVASFIFTFFMPSDLSVITDLINKRFKEVNRKLDRLDEKLDAMEESLKSNTAYNVFLSDFIQFKLASENGAKKLKNIRLAMQDKTRRIDQVKLAAEYVTFYENNNLGANVENLYKMAAKPDSQLHRNIFDRFIEEKGCDVTMLSGLMIKIKHIMASAAQQKLTYLYFKGDKLRARRGFMDIQKYMYEIRRAFNNRVWECRRDTVSHAKKDIDVILKAMYKSPEETIVKEIVDKLKPKYPWYSWAVASIKRGSPDLKSLIFLLGPERKLLEWRGTTYFTVENGDKRKILVVYDDAGTPFSCSNIKEANALLIFNRCEGCNSDFIYASDNFLTNKKCGDHGLEKIFKTTSLLSSLDYIAAAVRNDLDECKRSRKCNGNGLCKSIPFTDDVQCICYNNWKGTTCDKKETFDDSILKLIADLRLNFGDLVGVPTVVDTYFGIKDLSKKMDVLLTKIRSSFTHTQNVIKHSSIIFSVENIVDLYNQMQNGKISFYQFGLKLDNYLKTVTEFELQNRLYKMILGKGIIDTPGHDIYNTYKSEYVSKMPNAACKSQYNDNIRDLMNNLAYLDHALGEALLLHKDWLLKTKGTTPALRYQYINEAKDLKTLFKPRQKQYMDYWKTYSCGDIRVDGAGVNCKERLSFSGMSFSLTCDNQRQPSPPSLTCRKQSDSTLRWDANPVCKYVWGSFGSWGGCTARCGGGNQFRYRGCQGTSDVSNCKRDSGGVNYEYRGCNHKECCAAEFGKFKCSNGVCIDIGRLCDGNNDCGNNDDEDRNTCPNFLRSGSNVALKDLGHNNLWLSCYMAYNPFFFCKLRGCPGNTMDSNDWSRCSGETFNVYATMRNVGDAVRYGDMVAFKYTGTSPHSAWLSCAGGFCTTRGCPGDTFDEDDFRRCSGEMFRMFATARRGSCSTNTHSGCIGRPILKNDVIFVLYKQGQWLSGSSDDVRVRDCPGKFLDGGDESRCGWEKWQVVVKQ